MVFNSITFLIFFAVVLGLHSLPLSWTFKKANLLAASYLFYAAWNPPFVALLWISTLVDWHAAKRMSRAQTQGGRRLLLLASLGTNLGLLGYFKYGNFLLENLVAVLGTVGIQYSPPELDIVLPVGISFYTFQTLSYTLDVYRGNAKPWRSPLDFALYVTFFPQLVAGPIVRATHFLPQCEQPRRANPDQLGWGLGLLTLGLFQKIVMADRIFAPVADAVFGDAALATTGQAWIGTLAFAGQIFSDFAGYSTAAIGVALCLGFELPDNFRFPYAAVGFSDFWRRWHISLSSWLRDYLYIPLGGNRNGYVRTQVNLLLTMLIGGLWHGASWTFVVWGGLHGLYLVGERLLRDRLGPRDLGLAGAVTGAAVTFLLVCFAWVFFRATSFSDAASVLSAMVGYAGAGVEHFSRNEATLALVGIGGVLAVHWFMRHRSLADVVRVAPVWIRSPALAAMMTLIVTLPGDDRAFIYFQF